MAAPEWLVAAVLAALGAERLVELALNRRHVAWLRARGAVFAGADGLGLILVAQAALFAGTAAEALLAPWAAVGWWTWGMLALALAAQALRYWVIATLGPRWSIRVATLPGAPRVARGPYRFLRHPNYLAVAAEAVVVPLAFLAWGTALVAFPLVLVALARRIRVEERALRDAAPAVGAAEGGPHRA